MLCTPKDHCCSWLSCWFQINFMHRCIRHIMWALRLKLYLSTGSTCTWYLFFYCVFVVVDNLWESVSLWNGWHVLSSFCISDFYTHSQSAVVVTVMVEWFVCCCYCCWHCHPYCYCCHCCFFIVITIDGVVVVLLCIFFVFVYLLLLYVQLIQYRVFLVLW